MDIKALFGFEGKPVLVTGAGSGMGKAAAMLLTELGAEVYATVRSKPLDFPVAQEIKTDLSDPDSLDKLIRTLPGKLEALFICHGISNNHQRTNGLLVNLTNFYSFKYLTDRLVSRVADNGSVTFISSNGGRKWRASLPKSTELMACQSWEDALKWYEANPECTSQGYTFAKECQNAFVMTKVWSEAFIQRRIRLNAICPGLTATGLTATFDTSINGDPEYGHAVLEKMFLGPWKGRWAEAYEMGYPMVAIGSKLFSYVSGQVIYIDYGASSVDDMKELLAGDRSSV